MTREEAIKWIEEHNKPYADETKDSQAHRLAIEALRDQIEREKTEAEKHEERKQKKRERAKKYRESHRQQAYQTTKEWRKNNPEKWKVQQARYREKQRQKQKDGDGDGNDRV